MECDAVFLACLHLVKAHGPHAELGQRQPQILDRTPHDARMAPRAPLIAVAQVRVRVELDDQLIGLYLPVLPYLLDIQADRVR